MESSVTVQDKKEFIGWFLNEYRMKKRESTWILKYLHNHHDILENVHFVREAKLCPRGIVISTQCSREKPFCFYKDHLTTADAEKTFHDIRLNKDEPLFIQLNFKKAHQNAYYAAVLEENPYKPETSCREDVLHAEHLLKKTLYEYQISECMRKIDKALDENDQNAFYKWASRMEHIKLDQQNQPRLLRQ